MYPRFCPSGYHILPDVLGKGNYGKVSIATCDQTDYIVKLVELLEVSEIQNQNKAARIGISIPVVAVLYHNEQLGMVMERLDSRLSDELVLSEKQLQIAIPFCERYLTTLNDFLQAYSKLESCKEMMDSLQNYLRIFSTFRKIIEFYRMFYILNENLTSINRLRKDLDYARIMLSRGKPIKLPSLEPYSKNDKYRLDELINKYEAYWDFESCEDILKDWKRGNFSEYDIEEMKKFKIDIEYLSTSSIELPELPVMERIYIATPPEEKQRLALLMAKCIILVKKLGTLGILHNDLHDENIMKKGDRYYLIDFGLSSVMEEFSKNNDINNVIRIFKSQWDDTEYPIRFEQYYVYKVFDALKEKSIDELEQMTPSDIERLIIESTEFEGRKRRKCRYTMYI